MSLSRRDTSQLDGRGGSEPPVGPRRLVVHYGLLMLAADADIGSRESLQCDHPQLEFIFLILN